MGIPAWSNLEYEGRVIRRLFTLSKRKLVYFEKQCKDNPDYMPDMDELHKLILIYTKAANANLAIIGVVDHDERLKNIERLIENIPAHALMEAKAKIGN